MKTTAIILFLSGFMMKYFVNRRRFNRRTVTGMELFNSYEKAWLTKLIEKLAVLIGTGLIFLGLIILVMNW